MGKKYMTKREIEQIKNEVVDDEGNIISGDDIKGAPADTDDVVQKAHARNTPRGSTGFGGYGYFSGFGGFGGFGFGGLGSGYGFYENEEKITERNTIKYLRKLFLQEDRARAIHRKYKDKLDSDVVDKLLDLDPSDNEIFVDWLAAKHERGEDIERAGNLLGAYNFLYVTKRINNPTLPKRLSVDALEEKVKEYFDHVGDDFVLTEMRSHEQLCDFTTNKTNRPWCLSNRNDPSEWNLMDMMARQMGTRPKFYLYINLEKDKRHRLKYVGFLVYPSSAAQRMLSQPNEVILAQGNRRFSDLYPDREFAYSDEFMFSVFDELRDYGILLESYDSNNEIVLPSELERLIGSELFDEVTHL